MMYRSVEDSCCRNYQSVRWFCKNLIFSRKIVDCLRLPNKSGQTAVLKTDDGHQDEQKLCSTVDCMCYGRGKVEKKYV